MTSSSNWSRDETLLAFRLYFMNGKKLQKNSPQYVDLANALNRSVGSVKAKIENIEQSNPSFALTGRKGLSHGSKDLPEIWMMFAPDKIADTLAECDELYLEYYHDDPPEYPCRSEFIISALNAHRKGLSADLSVNLVAGDEIYRTFIKGRWKNMCAITHISHPNLISGYYIRPWVECTTLEKIDPHNGICLNTIHGELFEKYEITVNSDQQIVYSPLLKNTIPAEIYDAFFEKYEGCKLNFNDFDRYKPYLNYHNMRFSTTNNVDLKSLC